MSRFCGNSLFGHTLTKFSRRETMAAQTKRSHVQKVAFASAVGNWHYVVCVPKRLSAPKPPVTCCFRPRYSPEFLEMPELRDAIETTLRADSFIPFEQPISQVSGIAPKSPLLGAPIGTERKSASRYFKIAPAAQTATVLPLLTKHCGQRVLRALHAAGSHQQAYECSREVWQSSWTIRMYRNRKLRRPTQVQLWDFSTTLKTL